MLSINGSVTQVMRSTGQKHFEVSQGNAILLHFAVEKVAFYRALFGVSAECRVLPVAIRTQMQEPIEGTLHINIFHDQDELDATLGYHPKQPVKIVVRFIDRCATILMTNDDFVNLLAEYSQQDAQIKEEKVDKADAS